MYWLILCVVVALFWSISSFIDNYQTDVVFKKRKPQAMKVFDGTTYLAAAAIIFFIFGIEAIKFDDAILLILSGAIGAISSIPYLLALRDEEATSATVFYQLIPVIYLIVGWAFFHETISPIQLIGFIIILLAPIIIVTTRKRPKSRRLEIGAALLLLIYVVLYSISGLLSTRIGAKYDFTSVFFYFMIGRGTMDLIMFFCNAGWRQRMKYIWHRQRRSFLIAATCNQAITITTEFLNRYALIIGVASLVSVTANILQLIFTFMLGILLSIIWPKFGREKLKRHIVLAHLIATILAVIGIILIQ